MELSAVHFKQEFLNVLSTDLVDRSPITSPHLKPTTQTQFALVIDTLGIMQMKVICIFIRA
jgi:hypothetical protein